MYICKFKGQHTPMSIKLFGSFTVVTPLGQAIRPVTILPGSSSNGSANICQINNTV